MVHENKIIHWNALLWIGYLLLVSVLQIALGICDMTSMLITGFVASALFSIIYWSVWIRESKKKVTMEVSTHVRSNKKNEQTEPAPKMYTDVNLVKFDVDDDNDTDG